VPGIVAVIQTFGDRIILHPHLHFLVIEGGVDEAGRATLSDFVPVLSPRRDLQEEVRYFELNLTSGHAAIYHPQRWDGAKSVP
jgi:hypothetical protein